jgi:hypothetical protein
MAPGSLHHSGAFYTAAGPISDLAVASGDLRAYLVPAKTARQPLPDQTDNIIPFRPPPLDNIPAKVLEVLNQAPPQGERSEVAFKAIRHLTHLTDDDKLIAGTVLDHNIGERYQGRPRLRLYEEIGRARQYEAVPPEARRAERVVNQERLIAGQNQAIRLCTPPMRPTTHKVLVGYQRMSLKRGGGVFAASVAEVAIECGTEDKTVRRHRDLLVQGGWLQVEHQAPPGSGRASLFRLNVPRRTCVPDSSQVLGGGVKMSAFLGADSGGDGAEGASAGASASRKSALSGNPLLTPILDVSEDAARYRASGHMWEVLPYLSVDVAISPTDLGGLTGKSTRHVRRYIAWLFDQGLIIERKHIQLVPDWRDRWDDVAVKRGTAGKKHAAEDRLASDRLCHRRQLLVRSGEGTWMDDGRVVCPDSGEVI